jgi:hypothetical protein
MVAVTRKHSDVMATQENLHHNLGLGSDIVNWRRVAENVGVGGSVASLHKAFMNSPGHRANILDPKVTQIGVGVVGKGTRTWVTEVFRLRMDESKTPFRSSGSTANDQTTSTSRSLRTGGKAASLPSGTKTTPIVGDWDGNGSDTPGWYIDGTFYLSNNHDGSGTLTRFDLGAAGDLPHPGDWNGDGRDTVGVVTNREWQIINHLRGGAPGAKFVYGRIAEGDIPMSGDWNGNGRDTPAIVRDGEWHFVNSRRGGRSDFMFV